MLIAQITDPHIKLCGKLAYKKVDTAELLRACIVALQQLKQQPDLILITGDLVHLGQPEEYTHLKSILAPLRQRIIVIPGNHDGREETRNAFREGGYLPAEGFLQFAIDNEYPLRLIGLDTVVPGEDGGELCPERLAWLDDTLHQKPDVPTLIMMHHPPFLTGIGHMDKIGLKGAKDFAAIMRRHPHVELILCGHLHRTICAMVGGCAALTCQSPAYQIAFDIDPQAPSAFFMEPPGFMMHWWNGSGMVSHTVTIGDYPGPYPFFDADGNLID
ncbi:MAG: 3',5'-cyclic adenosine monophosphate phosphodiesterase CpdA [Syntrophomonadaceae bacterium]|nr:3',5'-cyclic adenosine monophosphate phosphodiesterase CpdA [Bacillota bacterium]